MREIVLPDYVQLEPTAGRYLAFVVRVDWPEVQLTPEQQFENAIDYGMGRAPRHDDHALIRVLVPIVPRDAR